MKRGFSLLELLVVVMILAVAIAAIGACLGAGIRVWDVAREFGGAETDALLAMDEMTRDLRNAVALADVPFVGETRSVAFGGLVWRGDPPQARFGQIRYHYRPGERQLIREQLEWRGGARFDPVATEVRAVSVLGLTLGYGQHADGGLDAAATNLPERVLVELTVELGRGQAPLVLRQTLHPTRGALP